MDPLKGKKSLQEFQLLYGLFIEPGSGLEGGRLYSPGMKMTRKGDSGLGPHNGSKSVTCNKSRHRSRFYGSR